MLFKFLWLDSHTKCFFFFNYLNIVGVQLMVIIIIDDSIVIIIQLFSLIINICLVYKMCQKSSLSLSDQQSQNIQFTKI